MPDTPWWQTAIIYQIYPRSFMDSNGDGVGDLNGITERLDYLQRLGVDALWLSPVYQSPMKDHGYDVSDYTAIDPLFGTVADFERLLAAAHQRDMRLILDFVPNHTSDQHAWFVESRGSKDSAKRDWYVWHDPKPGGDPPNNWRSYFGGGAWTLDEATGQYYLHLFAVEQPDLNWRNPAVKDAVFDSLRFWLDRGVDGFRFDVIDRLYKDEQWRDDPINPDYDPDRDQPAAATQRIYSENRPEVHDLIKDFQRLVKAYGDDRVTIGEIAYSDDPATMVPFYGDSASDEMDIPFNFALLLLSWDAKSIRDFIHDYERLVPNYGWTNYVLGNHDVPRLATRVGGDGARVAAMLLLTLRGTPFIYYGDELGMQNVPIPQRYIQDPQGIYSPTHTRDAARTPMRWNAEAYAGFSTVEPWLPVGEGYEQNNVEAQTADPGSMLNFYRALIAYRRANPVMQVGSYTELDYAPRGCLAYLRELDGERRLVVLNLTGEEKRVVAAGVDSDGQGNVALSTHPDHPATVTLRGIALRPHEGLLIEVDA